MATDADLRRMFLESRDFACPGCQYNLRDLAGDSCPECNQDLEFALVLAEPRMGALIGAIVGFAGAAAGGTALIVLLVVTSLIVRSSPPVGYYLTTGIPGALGTLGLALLARRQGRSWFRRSSRPMRTAVVIAAWATLAAFLFGMTISVIL